MAVARYYREDKNPEGASFPGVPTRDVTDDEWELLPEWVRASVDASDLYQKTRPDTGRRAPQRDAEQKET